MTGIVLAAAAMILLLFASVSPPAWESVYFLKASVGGSTTVFGVLGQCVKGGSCTSKHVGYDLTLNGASNVNINSTVLHNLTFALIIHPIAGFFAFVAVVFGLVGLAAASRVATIFMAIFVFFAGFLALVVFVIDMVLWNVVKDRIIDAGNTATLGNANWFTVGAVAASLLSVCTSCCGAFGRFATGRSAGEKY